MAEHAPRRLLAPLKVGPCEHGDSRPSTPRKRGEQIEVVNRD
jgi:hypothetical protein